jgi:hypothetical protein
LTTAPRPLSPTGLHIVIGLALLWVLRSHWSYDDDDVATATGASARQDKGAPPAESPKEASHIPSA